LSLDAMDWVWNQSTAKGTARLVLLAIADKAYGKDCSAYAGTTMLVQRCNAARSSVIAAVDKLIETGELAVIEGRVGPRGETFYALPKARRHRRSDQERGPESGPPPNHEHAESTPKMQHHSRSAREGGPKSGPVQNPDRSGFRTGTESGPGGSEIRTPGGLKSGPHNGSNTNTNPPSPPAAAEEGRNEGPQDRIPRAFDYIQPLIKAMSEAGIRVSWQMQPEDVQAIARVQQRAGVQQMVTFARGLKTRNGEPISFATFFLKSGWLGLAPAVDPQPPKSRDPERPHCGDPDCDPVTRTRETEDGKGIRSLSLCPVCHPKAKGHAA
jgi:hypothetical protein